MGQQYQSRQILLSSFLYQHTLYVIHEVTIVSGVVTSSVSLYRVGVASDVSVDTVAFRGINPINIPSSHSPVPSVVLVTAATRGKENMSIEQQ